MISSNKSNSMFIAVISMLFLTFLYLINIIWLIAVFSRFLNTFGTLIQLNFVIACHHIIRSIPIILILGTATICIVAFPPFIVFFPALAMLLISYFTEPGVRRFMPHREKDDGDWRYGFR